MKRILIVNADDCNLTPGVTQAILDCHDRGILTSTTFMVSLPVESRTVRGLLKRKKLGLGIHLNITLGSSVSKSSQVKSLLGPGGVFKKAGDQLNRLPQSGEAAREYQNQIDFFKKIFGKMPTHLDTHHQMHDHPFFLKVLLEVARRNRLPVRRSALMNQAAFKNLKGIRTPDYFFGNLTVTGYWRNVALKTVLSHLPHGTSEIMCHPGKNDPALRQISSFNEGRQIEYRLFSSPGLRKQLEAEDVTLSHYGLCYHK